MGSVNDTNGDLVDVSIALTPNDLKSVPALINEVSALGAPAAGDYEARQDLILKARALVQALETPRETMIKHCWAQPSAFTAITTGVEIGLFHQLVKDGGCSKGADDLATALKVDPKLLRRLMRHLAAMGYLIETGTDRYKPTNFAKSLTIPIIGDGYPCIAGCCMAALSRFPEWAKKNGYNMPNSISDGSYQLAYNTELNFFLALQSNGYGVQFAHHMGGYRQGKASWADPGFFPVKENLITGFDQQAEAVLLVDIGGSIGHDIDEFRRKHPKSPGRLIVQDLPEVIDQIKELDERIERMPYDFHNEQPVKGARAYYMHSVLHDWPDEVCANILARVTAAMKPGYSKLLINENVIPPTKADWQATALDIMMLTLLSSRERTEEEWRAMLNKAGLKICKIWSVANGVESLIECELA